jgi:hypothetical protein
MYHLTRYYEARCGWATVAVGCQLATRATVNRPVSVGCNARDLYHRAGRRRLVAGLRRHLLSRASVFAQRPDVIHGRISRPWPEGPLDEQNSKHKVLPSNR